MRMRAAVLEKFEPLVVQELELTEPKAGEHWSTSRPAGSATDLYTASGVDPLFPAPTVLGHEGAGVVEAVGPEVTSLEVGDHVVTLFSPQCGECVHCRDERTNLCLAIREQQNKGYLPDGTSPAPRRRGDPALHGHLDLRRIHRHARDRARQGQSGGAARARLPVRLRALDRPRRRDEHGQGPRGLDLRRLRRRHGRPRRRRRVSPPGRGADHLHRPLRGQARARPRPGRHRDDDRRRRGGRAHRGGDRRLRRRLPSRRRATSR